MNMTLLWISTADRLPEPLQNVLLYFKPPYGDVEIGNYYDGKWWSTDETWWVSGDEMITHWTPLPIGPELEEAK